MLSVLPYGNDRPVKRFPAVTYALIVANILVYIWSSSLGEDIALNGMGLIPQHPSFVTILTSMFVHGSLLHLVWNMLYLYLFGPNVEEALGNVAYSVFYFASGFSAALLHILVSLQFFPHSSDLPMVGASGAIAGILGLYAVRYYKTNLRLWLVFFSISIPAWIALGVWFVQQLAYGMAAIIEENQVYVAYWSHIGGMAFGILLAYALRMGREGTKEYLMSDALHSLENGTTWGAAECLLSLLKRNPENPDVHYELGRTYAIQNNPVQAITHFRKSIEYYLHDEKPDKAVDAYNLLHQHYPSVRLNCRIEFKLANHMVDEGNCEAALGLLENIVKCSADSPEAETAMVKIGDIYMNNFDAADRAIFWYERFMREYPVSTYSGMVQSCISRLKNKQ